MEPGVHTTTLGRDIASGAHAVALRPGPVGAQRPDQRPTTVSISDHLSQGRSGLRFRDLARVRSGLSSGYRAEARGFGFRSEEHTSELQSQSNLVCRLLLEKKTTK